MFNPPSDLLTLHQEQQNRRTQTSQQNTQKETERASKQLTLRSSFETSACRSPFFFSFITLTTSLSFLSRHVHGERQAFLAVTVDFPDSPSQSSARESSQHCEHSERGELSDSELTQHASLISWQRRSTAMWQLNATRPSSQSSRKSATLDQSCPMSSPHNPMCSHSRSKIHIQSTEGTSDH